jgi:hypothetical protein
MDGESERRETDNDKTQEQRKNNIVVKRIAWEREA